MSVLVVGNCTYDRSFGLDRFPRPGETLLADWSAVDIGGKGANQAVAATLAGARVLFCSAVGNDAEGDEFVGRLARAGVDLRHLLRRRGGTDTSIIYLVRGGENAIVSTHAITASLQPPDVAGALEEIGPRDVLLLQGNLGRDTTRFTLQDGRRRGARVVVNPAPIQYRFDDLWPQVDIAIVNEVEAAVLGNSPDPVAAARAILAGGAGLVVATLGPAGALVVDPLGVWRISAPPVEAVDTTGAGDVFCGVFAAGLDRGLQPRKAARWAVAAASISVTRRGTQRAFPTPEELALLLGQLGPEPHEGDACQAPSTPVRDVGGPRR